MTPLKSYTLFNEDSENNMSKVIKNTTGNTLFLTVYGDVQPSIQIEQLIDTKIEEWQKSELIIQKSPLSVVPKIEKFGLYEIPISGARRVRLLNTNGEALGKFTVYGTVGE